MTKTITISRDNQLILDMYNNGRSVGVKNCFYLQKFSALKVGDKINTPNGAEVVQDIKSCNAMYYSYFNLLYVSTGANSYLLAMEG